MGKKVVVVTMIIFLLTMTFLSIRTVFIPGSRPGSQTVGADSLGVIRIDGVITGDSSTSWTGAMSNAEDIMAAIREAGQRDDIKAVVLRINSPGGTSGASQEIGTELDKLRAKGKPVVTSMGDACASGGYWIACSSDYIMANPTTLTGSIGVIMELTNLEGLYGKLGIRQEAIKSGAHKDIGSPSREITEEERTLLEGLVKDSYQQFLDQVMKGRKDKIDRERLLGIADGRVFTGKQAQEYGLVDGLGNYYDAIAVAQQMSGLDATSKVEELNGEDIWEAFLRGSSLSSLLEFRSWPVLRY